VKRKKSWLAFEVLPTAPPSQLLSEKLAAQKKELIETALAKFRGAENRGHSVRLLSWCSSLNLGNKRSGRSAKARFKIAYS
jgi:hypothetical protein